MAAKKKAKKKIVKKKAKKKTKEKIIDGITGVTIYTNGNGKPVNGRPPRSLELERVFDLASIGCTQQEIYSVLKINKSTFIEMKKNNPILQEIVDFGRQSGNASLRRKQMQVAMGGNPQMLIWLGKNKLKQSDRSINHIELSQGETFKQALLGDDSEEENEEE